MNTSKKGTSVSKGLLSLTDLLPPSRDPVAPGWPTPAGLQFALRPVISAALRSADPHDAALELLDHVAPKCSVQIDGKAAGNTYNPRGLVFQVAFTDGWLAITLVRQENKAAPAVLGSSLGRAHDPFVEYWNGGQPSSTWSGDHPRLSQVKQGTRRIDPHGPNSRLQLIVPETVPNHPGLTKFMQESRTRFVPRATGFRYQGNPLARLHLLLIKGRRGLVVLPTHHPHWWSTLVWYCRELGFQIRTIDEDGSTKCLSTSCKPPQRLSMPLVVVHSRLAALTTNPGYTTTETV